MNNVAVADPATFNSAPCDAAALADADQHALPVRALFRLELEVACKRAAKDIWSVLNRYADLDDHDSLQSSGESLGRMLGLLLMAQVSTSDGSEKHPWDCWAKVAAKFGGVLARLHAEAEPGADEQAVVRAFDQLTRQANKLDEKRIPKAKRQAAVRG